MRLYLPIIITIFLLAFYSTNADDQSKILAEDIQLNISATETLEVTNDLLTAILRIEQNGEDQNKVQNSINETMSNALSMAKKYLTVAVSTDQYYVYHYDQDQGTDGTKKLPSKKMWYGNQALYLKSTTGGDLLKLAGELQASGLLMQNLSYSLSNDKKEFTRDSLLEAALLKLTQRCMRVAKSLNKKYSGFILINIDPASLQQPIAMPMMKAMSAVNEKVISPIAEPGTSEVSITVNATALLK